MSLQYPDREGIQCGKNGRENMGKEHVLLIHSFQTHDVSGPVVGAEGGVREQDKEKQMVMKMLPD